MKKKIIMLIFICGVLFLCSCRNKEIQKKGVGMFENASVLNVTYNDETYKIEDEQIVTKFSEICDGTHWKNPDSDELISREECALKIEFVDARATLYLDDKSNIGYLNDIPIIITDRVQEYIADKIIR